MNGREAARRIVSQNELSDTEALEHIAGLLNGTEWNTDTIAQIATLVRDTGRDVAQPQDDDVVPGYDMDEGEFGDYIENPDDVLVALSSIAGNLSRAARCDKTAIPDSTGEMVRHSPGKPVPVDRNMDAEGHG